MTGRIDWAAVMAGLRAIKCRLGLHVYGPWRPHSQSELHKVYSATEKLAVGEAIVQERWCRNCNKLKLRCERVMVTPQ